MKILLKSLLLFTITLFYSCQEDSENFSSSQLKQENTEVVSAESIEEELKELTRQANQIDFNLDELLGEEVSEELRKEILASFNNDEFEDMPMLKNNSDSSTDCCSFNGNIEDHDARFVSINIRNNWLDDNEELRGFGNGGEWCLLYRSFGPNGNILFEHVRSISAHMCENNANLEFLYPRGTVVVCGGPCCSQAIYGRAAVFLMYINPNLNIKERCASTSRTIRLLTRKRRNCACC